MPVRRGTASHNRSAHRARPATVLCSEKYACSTENAEAVFRCDECATNQCHSCEHQLHQLARYQYHDRQKLPEPLPDQLCEQAAIAKCFPKNFADVICVECGHRRYCINCDAAVHRPRTLSKHTRISILSHSWTPSASTSSPVGDQTSLLLPSDTSELTISSNAEDGSLYISLPSFHSATSEVAGDEAVTADSEIESAANVPDVDLSNESCRTSGDVLSADFEKSCSRDCCQNSDDIVDSLAGSVISPSCEVTMPASFQLLSEHEELLVKCTVEHLP